MTKYDLAWLNAHVDGVPATALVRILKRQELPFSHSNRADLLQRILKLVDAGEIDSEVFPLEVRLIEECSSKVIFVLKIKDVTSIPDDFELRSRVSAAFGDAQSKIYETIKRPERPTLNYLGFDDSTVRLKVSETQTQIIPDFSRIDEDDDRMAFRREDHTNVVVFSVDRKKGDAIVYCDSPWRIHPHGNGEAAYFKHYLDSFGAIFGDFSKTNFAPKIRRLFNIDPGDRIFRTKIITDLTSTNIHRRLAGENLEDDEHCCSVVSGKDPGTMHYNSFVFLKDRSTGNLLSDTHVNVHPLEGRIHIPAQRLHTEVDYVISALR